MARRRKPHDPAASTQAALDRKDREAEIARMEAQGATVSVDRGGQILSAYRSNVFRLLLERKTIALDHHNAAEWLCGLWATWKGLDGKPEMNGEAVDGGSGSKELVSDRMLRAGREATAALSALSTTSRLILIQFMVATVEEDRAMAWRGIMERIGIKSLEEQTTAVVVALEELREYYQGSARRAA